MTRNRAALAGTLVMSGAIAALLIAQKRAPARRSSAREPRRTARNLVLGAAALTVASTIERPVAERLAQRNVARHSGLGRQIAAFLILDATIYAWHVATHRVPLLWRFHRVHHIDTAMDMTTALRFHAIDMAVSTPVRAAQVIVSGATPATLSLWQHWFGLHVLFHHADIRLPDALERRLSWLITTPAMHDTHHRRIRAATDSNYSAGFSLWDRLFGTFRREAGDQEQPVGVPGYEEPDCAIEPSLRLPFVRGRERWPDPPCA